MGKLAFQLTGDPAASLKMTLQALDAIRQQQAASLDTTQTYDNEGKAQT